MFRRSFFARLLAVIISLSILAWAGFMVFRAGQAQGYALGVATAAQGDQLQPPQGALPAVPYAYPGYYYRPHFGFFAPFGFLFFIGWMLFLFFVVGGLFRFLAWGRFGRGPWGHHHHYPYPGQDQAPEQPAKPAE